MARKWNQSGTTEACTSFALPTMALFRLNASAKQQRVLRGLTRNRAFRAQSSYLGERVQHLWL